MTKHGANTKSPRRKEKRPTKEIKEEHSKRRRWRTSLRAVVAIRVLCVERSLVGVQPHRPARVPGCSSFRRRVGLDNADEANISCRHRLSLTWIRRLIRGLFPAIFLMSARALHKPLRLCSSCPDPCHVSRRNPGVSPPPRPWPDRRPGRPLPFTVPLANPPSAPPGRVPYVDPRSDRDPSCRRYSPHSRLCRLSHLEASQPAVYRRF